ncbi:MAG: lipoyl synthase [Clostridia bacterium]|nr:lipoyl synthase [Clostridia bacterium]
MAALESRSPAGDPKKPEWLRVRYNAGETKEVLELMKKLGLHTVCSGANCPNLGECWARRTATFMILGDRCTRNCRFCDVPHGKAGEFLPPDPGEPRRIAEAARDLKLKHAVVTCVTRDDLPDGGASVFAAVIREVRALNPETTVEVLVSDLGGNEEALDTVLAARPDVFNHNVETVPSLTPKIRSGAKFERSLAVLRRAKETGRSVVKTGLILGLGEEDGELFETFRAIRDTGCDILTLSQYLRPSQDHWPLARYVSPAEFDRYREEALKLGFPCVLAAPLVRSSYKAAEAMEAVRAADVHTFSKVI